MVDLQDSKLASKLVAFPNNFIRESFGRVVIPKLGGLGRDLPFLLTRLAKQLLAMSKKYAVRWIYKPHVEYSSEAARTDEDQQQNTRKRQRLHPEIWTQAKMANLKKSKKQGCLAKLKVIVYKADPTNVVLITEKEHNHIIGSLGDLQYLPLSDDAKALIETRLREGYRKRETRFANQQS
ncbi:hypothetical protein [Parasitella parasitica]|uniref:Uncharacterized protein n=1 Tax=Parasitella parasitica TaxID=35722 RepID=A0A0B7MP91_9FUNG|nr:hypothetical protein [Parasitella parasitica]